MTSKVSRVCISIPSDLLEEFDKLIKRMGWDRSKAVQNAVRTFLAEYKWKEEGFGAGAIALIYDHSIRGLEERLTEIQHSCKGVIESAMHVHLDERNCLEIIAVKGQSVKIRELADKLLANRGVKQLKTILLST